MTQTGGLVVLLAWILFGAILAILAYFLLRHERDPLQEAVAPTADQLATPGETPPADDAQHNPPHS
jgi:hypothetical protein